MRAARVTASLLLIAACTLAHAEVFCTGDGAGGFRCVENGRRVVPPPPEYRASAPKRVASAPAAPASAPASAARR
jgi:hypothetical protein